MVDDFSLFALGVVAVMCFVLFFTFGIVVDSFFCTYVYLPSCFFFHLVTHTHWPKPTHPLCKGFALTRIAWNWNVGGWWVVSGVGWTTFRVPPYESDFILVTHVREIICYLLILFTTQSGSCTLRPPRLLICCFLLRRRQISSDISSSPRSSTATKTQTSKGLAWRPKVDVQFR